MNEQFVTFFIRGFDDGRKLGELSPEHRFAEELREQAPVLDVTQRIDDDQTYRYAEASGDPMPIHLDEEVARGGRAAGDHRPRVLRPRLHVVGDPAGARRVGRPPPAPACRALLEAGAARTGDPYARVGEGPRGRRRDVRVRDDGGRDGRPARRPRGARGSAVTTAASPPAHPGGAARGDARKASRRDDREHPRGRLCADHHSARRRAGGRLGGRSGVPLPPSRRPRGGGRGAPRRAPDRGQPAGAPSASRARRSSACVRCST